MNKIFEIPSGIRNLKDDVLSYIEEIELRDFNFQSGMVSIQFTEFEHDFKSSLEKLQDRNKQNWGILTEEISRMGQELGRLIRFFKGFYLTKSDFTDISKDGLSPQEVNFLINRTLIRIKRMVCVYDPEFDIIEFKDKKKPDRRYIQVKGYWINDEGKRERSFSKSVQNSESSMVELLTKILKSNLHDVEVFENVNIHGFSPDVVLSVKKEKWVVEVKYQEMKNLIKIYVMMEMWKMYKECYELIN